MLVEDTTPKKQGRERPLPLPNTTPGTNAPPGSTCLESLLTYLVPSHPPPVHGELPTAEKTETSADPVPRTRKRHSARPSAPPPRRPLPTPHTEETTNVKINTELASNEPSDEASKADSEDSPKIRSMKIHPDLMSKDLTSRRAKTFDTNLNSPLPIRQRGTGFRGRPDWIKTETYGEIPEQRNVREQLSPRYARSRSPSPTPLSRGRVKDTLSFYSFVRGISVMTRGSPTEKAQCKYSPLI